MAAPAAGEVPAVAALLVSMAAALAWAASAGMLEVWRRSLGKLLIWMADNLDKASIKVLTKTIRPLAPLASMLRSLVHTVDHYLGEAVQWSSKAAATFFHFFLSINLWMAREIADLAQDTWHALSTTTSTTVNQVTKVVTHTVVKPISKSVTVVTKTSVAGLRALNHRVDILGKIVAHQTAIAAGAIAAPWPRLERKARSAEKRIGRLEKRLGGVTFVALVAAALTRLGLNWIRKPCAKRTSDSFCRADTGLLDILTYGMIATTATLSFRQFVEASLFVEEEVVNAISWTVPELAEAISLASASEE